MQRKGFRHTALVLFVTVGSQRSNEQIICPLHSSWTTIQILMKKVNKQCLLDPPHPPYSKGQ